MTGAQFEVWVLSDRQVQVARLLVQGKSNRDIAGELNIAERTVKFHVANILTRLGCCNRTAAAAKIALRLHGAPRAELGPKHQK
jgi:DNA-binding NarL/FixJ family response regulator